MPFLTVQTPGAPLQKLEVDGVDFDSTGPNAGMLIAKKDGKAVASWNLADIVGWNIRDQDEDPK
jgi:hypothetical protein